MHIGIIGTGYVGLVSGACLADFGNKVTCMDKDPEKINALKSNTIPFYEPGLEDLVKRNVKLGTLSFTTEISEIVKTSQVIIIAVGTPSSGDGSPDLSHVLAVSKDIASHIDSYRVIVIKSTVAVGTSAKMTEIIKENLASDVPFDIVSNPEFLREGSAIADFMKPDRVVIGADSDRAMAVLSNIYNPLSSNGIPFVFCSNRTAELIKYASNTFLATKISFINEMANLCFALGVDIQHITRAMGLDHRIGAEFLHPGPGFGGSCLPKDVRALMSIAEEHNVDMKVLKAAWSANEHQSIGAAEMIAKAISPIKGKSIAFLGLSFKANTDDIRESPAIRIIDELLNEGAVIRAYDPAAMDNARETLKNVSFTADAYEAIKGANALVLATEWNEFRSLDLEKVKDLLKEPFFFDFRNIYDPKKMKREGFEFYSMGRSNPKMIKP